MEEEMDGKTMADMLLASGLIDEEQYWSALARRETRLDEVEAAPRLTCGGVGVNYTVTRDGRIR